jgi:hypothetical protein
MIGSEGIVGIPLFMGEDSMQKRAVVARAGQAYALEGQVLKQEFSRGGALQHHLLRYTQARLTQLMQNVVCTRSHSVDQQLCRSLLMCLDRLAPNEKSMDQELIRTMIKVPGTVMTEAVGKLQLAGLVRNDLDRITVLDRSGLEARVCECYEVVRQEFRRLLSGNGET